MNNSVSLFFGTVDLRCILCVNEELATYLSPPAYGVTIRIDLHGYIQLINIVCGLFLCPHMGFRPFFYCFVFTYKTRVSKLTSSPSFQMYSLHLLYIVIRNSILRSYVVYLHAAETCNHDSQKIDGWKLRKKIWFILPIARYKQFL